MMNGFFSGAILNIMGCDSTLQIIHAGENACLKKLTVKRNARPENFFQEHEEAR